MANRKTIAILGGGSAGFTAARVAHELGAKVLLFMGARGDRTSLCIERGCMPSKAMFEPIDAMHRAKRHGWLEVQPRQPNEYLAQIVAWKDREIAGFRSYRHKEILKRAADDFQIIHFPARFSGPHEVEDGQTRYTFDAAIIATGSSNSIPPEVRVPIGLDGAWTNSEILANTTIPKTLGVIGAGAIALEFSLRYARLGCQVTMLSRSGVLSRYPKKFGARLQEIYQREGVRILAGRELRAVERADDGGFRISTQEDKNDLFCERVLVATGRHPAVKELNLAAAGIELTERGKLEIDLDMRVKGSTHIFAAGDVAGLRMVVHQAHIEAGIAAENAVKESARKWERRSNLQVVFSDPEFAFAGMSRESAEQAGHEVRCGSAESADIGKLHLAGDDLGFGELIADAKDGRLLGAGLLCDDASNLIHLPAYAIDHSHTVHDLIDAEYYHPTKIEIVSEIGDALCREMGGTPFCRARE